MASIDLSFDYKKIGKTIVRYLGQYRLILTALIVLVVIGMAIMQVNTLANPELNQDRLNEQKLTLRKVKFNDAAVEQILTLIDSNVDISSQFTNRDNPFAE